MYGIGGDWTQGLKPEEGINPFTSPEDVRMLRASKDNAILDCQDGFGTQKAADLAVLKWEQGKAMLPIYEERQAQIDQAVAETKAISAAKKKVEMRAKAKAEAKAKAKADAAFDVQRAKNLATASADLSAINALMAEAKAADGGSEHGPNQDEFNACFETERDQIIHQITLCGGVWWEIE